MSVKKPNPVGAQPTDPPWARLLFTLVEGPDRQCWRAILLVTPLLLLMAGFVMVAMKAAPVSWISGAMGVGSLTALAICRRRRAPESLRSTSKEGWSNIAGRRRPLTVIKGCPGSCLRQADRRLPPRGLGPHSH